MIYLRRKEDVPLEVYKKHLILRWSAGILGVISLGIVGLVSFWLNYPYNVIDVYNEPMPIELVQPYPGGVVFVDFDYCKFGDFKGTVTRYLVMSDREIKLPEQPEVTPKNCDSLLKSPLFIPENLNEHGDIYVRYEISYPVNPMRPDFKEVFRTQKFRLTAKP